MSAQPKQTQGEKDRILRTLPPDAHRIQVREDSGALKFKKPEDVLVDDEIVVKGDGSPVLMMQKPGRKPKVNLTALSDEIEDVMSARQDHIGGSDLVTAATNDPEADEVISNILQGMAQEAAALEFERMEAERKGMDTSGLSARRARVLKAMADVWLKRKEKLQGGAIDLDSKSFETLMTFLMETLKGSMEDAGMRPEFIETVFTKLSKRLADGWKEEAKARMREGS